MKEIEVIPECLLMCVRDALQITRFSWNLIKEKTLLHKKMQHHSSAQVIMHYKQPLGQKTHINDENICNKEKHFKFIKY